MVRVTLWPQLLLVVLILHQSAAVSDQLERDIEQLQTKIDGLTKTVDSINQAVQILVEKQEQLQNTNDGLTKTVDSINQAVQILVEKQEQQQTTNDGLTKTVESLNQTSQLRCGTPEDVCRSLIEAAESGDVDSAKRLVKCSNDNCTDNYKYRMDTPMITATWKGHVELVRVLLEGGANVEGANVQLRTALHAAAHIGHLDICRLLLDWGAKVDALTDAHYTPLHYAAFGGHLSVVKLLVERGANVSLESTYGENAIGIARTWERKDVVDWLDSLGSG